MLIVNKSCQCWSKQAADELEASWRVRPQSLTKKTKGEALLERWESTEVQTSSGWLCIGRPIKIKQGLSRRETINEKRKKIPTGSP